MIFTQLLNLCCKPLINRLAFVPSREDINTPLPSGFEEKFIITEDNIKIHTIYIPNKTSKRIIIYFHGNAGNIYHRFETLQMLSKLNINILGISYRGYGKSEGKPSEEGIYKDGKSAINYVLKDLGFKQNEIFLLGRSIGSAPATNTAENYPVGGLILVTPIYSGKYMARHTGLGFLAPLAGDAFDNSKKLKNIKTPTLIIHGTDDETVPFWMGKTLYNENKDKTTFIEIKNGTHNELEYISPEKYWTGIKNFIRKN